MGYRTINDRIRVSVNFDDSISMTEQSHAASCDVTNILSRYVKTGTVERSTEYLQQYGDFTQVLSYQESLDRLRDAQDMFMSLDSKVRARFENNPALFLDFCSDEKNRDEMFKMNLLKEDLVQKDDVVLENV